MLKVFGCPLREESACPDEQSGGRGEAKTRIRSVLQISKRL